MALMPCLLFTMLITIKSLTPIFWEYQQKVMAHRKTSCLLQQRQNLRRINLQLLLIPLSPVISGCGIFFNSYQKKCAGKTSAFLKIVSASLLSCEFNFHVLVFFSCLHVGAIHFHYLRVIINYFINLPHIHFFSIGRT